uniref:Uncharacterized protein n=1 Tax=Arundo donax TaxID=35708 RepID=A0A0A9SXE5_ARUDO
MQAMFGKLHKLISLPCILQMVELPPIHESSWSSLAHLANLVSEAQPCR